MIRLFHNPDADELCDAVDRNCDTSNTQDAIDPNTYYSDSDNDGFGDKDNTKQACTVPGGYTEDDTDCNDQNGSINPNATEVCNNTDDNCNGTLDENLPMFPHGILTLTVMDLEIQM